MFDKQYRFKGRHAYRVDMLTGVFDNQSKAKLFNHNLDVYINAPLVGFLYNRHADLDSTKNPQTNQVYDESVFSEQIIGANEDLTFNFQLIMLLDKDYEPDEQKRIDKAFRNLGKDPADEERFDSYVRGGVDVLYEKLIDGSNDPDAFVNGLYDFMEEFENRFNSETKADDILKLCMNK